MSNTPKATITAGDVAGDPDLFNRAWYIGSGRMVWECLGWAGETVKFGRLIVTERGLRPIIRYIPPETQMREERV